MKTDLQTEHLYSNLESSNLSEPQKGQKFNKVL